MSRTHHIQEAVVLALAFLFAGLGIAEAATARIIVPPPAGITLSASARPNALTLKTETGLPPTLLRQVVPYRSSEKPGTIVVNTGEKYLYLVLGHGRAMRYGIGVAKSGFEWSGTHAVTAKREWPDWTPPAEMLQRRPDIPTVDNPLGARALYIGSTLYRIHGTNQPWTIGGNVSSGCIRLTNEDVIDLYTRAKIGAKVIVF
jgi:lipoprotein-anchoring transpeptidase ErfK/SrfK